MGSLQIDILGTSFSIKANEDSEYLNKLLGYYKRMVDQIERTGSLTNPLQVSILSGIMLCDELYKEKGRNVKFQSVLEKNTSDAEAARITKSMIEKIEQVLK